MITRDINEVANELTNLVTAEIFRIAKERQEETIDLHFNYHHDFLDSLSVDFSADDEELTEEEYLDGMYIVVNLEYTDQEDGLIYEKEELLSDMELGVLLEIYNTIK